MTELHDQIRAAQLEGHPLDWGFGLALADKIETLLRRISEMEGEGLLLRDLVADVDLLFDSPDGDLFQAGHNCRCQRRVAQFYEQVWKKNFAQRGGTRARVTYGRGRG